MGVGFGVVRWKTMILPPGIGSFDHDRYSLSISDDYNSLVHLSEDEIIELYNQLGTVVPEIQQRIAEKKAKREKKCCSTCKHLNGEMASMDYPYPVFWCGKGHHDGGPYGEMEQATNCEDWESEG